MFAQLYNYQNNHQDTVEVCQLQCGNCWEHKLHVQDARVSMICGGVEWNITSHLIGSEACGFVERIMGGGGVWGVERNTEVTSHLVGSEACSFVERSMGGGEYGG